MNRREVLGLIGGTAFAGLRAAAAQQPSVIPRVFVLMGGTPAVEAPRLSAFREAVERLGHVNGRTVHIEAHYAEGLPDRLGPIARELVDRNPAVIVCVGSQEVTAVQAVTRSIPIIFMQSGDAVEQGLVASFARPGGNTTGFTQMVDELESKRLELLHEIAPSLSRAALLTDSHLTRAGRLEKRLASSAAAAKVLGMVLRPFDATTPAELTDALTAIAASDSEALLVPNDPLFASERSRILDFATAHRLPTVFESKPPVIEGGCWATDPI